MQLRYKSDYPNQVQQLNIFLSQHYHLLKDGIIHWQKSPFNISWKDYQQSKKRHLVSYIIRDHFSNCFYAELHPADAMPAIYEFLFNAWREKEGYEFWGGPEYLIVPKTTQDQFPSLLTFFSKTEKVKLQTPTSGFSTGLAAVRQWENYIRYFTDVYKDCKSIEEFKSNIEPINREINLFKHRDKSTTNLDKWLDNQPKILRPGDQARFYGFFT